MSEKCKDRFEFKIKIYGIQGTILIGIRIAERPYFEFIEQFVRTKRNVWHEVQV